MAWIQLIFNSSADSAEDLADQLMACGAAAVTFRDNADQAIYEPDVGTTPLWQSTSVIALYDAETDSTQVMADLNQMREQDPIVNYRVEAVEEKDWVREWMSQFQPISFGQRLWVCPSWHQPPDSDAINVLLDPGLAFGTGTHPTTALCLNWLDQQNLADKVVIDYGCGSGILAIAAALLGASKVIAIDIDPQAIEATQANAERNNVNIESYLNKEYPAIQADVVIANILAGPLQGLAEELTALSKPQSTLLLSGILASQAQAVSASYQAYFDMSPPKQQQEWIRLVGQRRG